jgi:hypothetical protein
MTMVMLLLLSLRSCSGRDLGLRVVVFMSVVEWHVNMFWDCTTWMGMIPEHTANQVLRFK